MSSDVHVVATAGHVDHGKSTLVQALTGSNPDRLADEHRRGMSIELGYCWMDLPPVGQVAFVDVPGHERFVGTAFVGLAEVDTVMFVVAADDPWMPQAETHLEALNALGVARGLLVIARCDIADPAPALKAARASLAHTSLEGIPHVCVSARTGLGLGELRQALAGVLASPSGPRRTNDLRFWVDRHFHVRGVGSVVTGSLSAGEVSTGDRLMFNETQIVRVRGLQCMGVEHPRLVSPARVAMSLASLSQARPDRGDCLTTPSAFRFTSEVDVHISGIASPPQMPIMHFGSMSVVARVRPLGEDVCRLTFNRRLPFRIGDRAILRDPGQGRIWGVQILDPFPPPLVRRGDGRRRGDALTDSSTSLGSYVRHRGAVALRELRFVGFDETTTPPNTVLVGPWLLSTTRRDELHGLLLEQVRASARAGTPLSVSAAARRLGLEDFALVRALVAHPLAWAKGAIVEQSAKELSSQEGHVLSRIKARLTKKAFLPPTTGELRDWGAEPRVLRNLAEADEILLLDDNVVLLPDADRLALAAWECLEQPFTVSEARVALSSTRRTTLSLLKHFEKSDEVIRQADGRRQVARRR